MTIASVLKQKQGVAIISVTPETTMSELAGIITSKRIGALVVLDAAQKLVGIVSERDVVKAVHAHGAAALGMTAGQLMTHKPVTATPDSTVDEAMEIMDQGYFRHLPVMRGDTLVGIVSIRDLVKYRIMQQRADVDDLKSYVYRVGS
jgi:CBS domain-containing protein